MGASAEQPITADQVMPLLLAACPSFEQPWADEVRDYNREDNFEPETSPKAPPPSLSGRLDYLDAGDFVRHLVDLKLAGRVDEFPAIFQGIETLVTLGDPYVQNLAVIGYIEGLQMMTVTSTGLNPERDFRPYLRQVSDTKWEAINAFWEQRE